MPKLSFLWMPKHSPLSPLNKWLIRTTKQGVVNDFLLNPNWRQSRFCFWIDETRWAKNETIWAHIKRPTSGGSLQSVTPFPSTPRPLDPFPGTRCFWRNWSWFSFQKKVLRLPTPACRASLACVMYSSLLAPHPLPVVIHRWPPWPLNPPTSC